MSESFNSFTKSQLVPELHIISANHEALVTVSFNKDGSAGDEQLLKLPAAIHQTCRLQQQIFSEIHLLASLALELDADAKLPFSEIFCKVLRSVPGQAAIVIRDGLTIRYPGTNKILSDILKCY